MTWPVLNIIRLSALVSRRDARADDVAGGSQKANDAPTTPTAVGSGPFAELFYRHLRLSTYLTVALVVYFWFCPLDRAGSLEAGWILEIVARNLVIEAIFYGGWHVVCERRTL